MISLCFVTGDAYLIIWLVSSGFFHHKFTAFTMVVDKYFEGDALRPGKSCFSSNLPTNFSTHQELLSVAFITVVLGDCVFRFPSAFFN